MAESGRVIALDLGDRRIGVAICDSGRILATPHGVIKRCGDETVEHGEVGELVAEFDATMVVVGLPIGLSGDSTHKTAQAEAEIKRLAKRLKVDVCSHDERFTTTEAANKIRAASNKVTKDNIDAAAATVILESWLALKNC